MHESLEGEGFNEDALFGSGVEWIRVSDEDQPVDELQFRQSLNQVISDMEREAQNLDLNNIQFTSAVGQVSQPHRIYLSGPAASSSQPRLPSMSFQQQLTTNPMQPGTSQESGGARNKTTKNNENKVKNSNQKKQNSGVNESVFRNTPVENNERPPFQPVLQAKRHDIEPADRRTRNSIKEKKQSKNSSIAQGMAVNHPLSNGVDAECSSLVANGINPDESSKNISRVYVKQTPNGKLNSSQKTKRVDSNEYSLPENLESGDLFSVDSETGMKVVSDCSFTQINNDLWDRKKKDNNSVSHPSLQFQAPSLNLSFASGQTDVETDEVPNRSPAVLSTPSDSLSQSLFQNQPEILNLPIVSQYDNRHGRIHSDNQSPPVSNEDSNLALSLNGDQISHVFQDDRSTYLDSFPSSLLFGTGNMDELYSQQQLRLHLDRENQISPGLDQGPDEFYNYNLHNESSYEAEQSLPDHVVTLERLHNDVYEPEEGHNCDNVVTIPFDIESRPEEVPTANMMLPPPDIVQTVDCHGASEQTRVGTDYDLADLVLHFDGESPLIYTRQDPIDLHSHGGADGGGRDVDTVHDEELARMLQEELDLEDSNRDEQFALHLQQMEDDNRYRPRGPRERGTHQPLRTRYGDTWRRPLRVEHGENVFDSQPRRYTWDRPLRHRGSRTHDLSYLGNLHNIPDHRGYDIPPGGDLYLNEYDPDFILDDHEDDLVSISRDPRMLASMLMVRAPDMMVPNSIDLNDYEALWELAEGLGEVRRVGMEQAEISLLPIHTYSPSPGSPNSSKTDCLVCLSAFTAGEQLRTLPCCHIYHLECIDEWLKRNAICPVCRQSAKQGEQ